MFAFVTHESLEMNRVEFCHSGRRNDILERTNHFIVRCYEASKSRADLEVRTIAVIQLPVRCPAAVVAVVRASRGQVGFLKSASESTSDESVRYARSL